MFRQRLISGVFLVLIAIVTLYLGGIVTFLVTAAISLIGMYELLRVIKMQRTGPAVIVYCGAVLYYVLLWFGLDRYDIPLALAVLVVLLAVYVFTFPKYRISRISITFVSLIYVAVMMSCIYRIRILDGGGFMVVLVFLSAWGNDTVAYCAGRLFGKHKITPVLSPKKTVEGAVGGIVGAGILGFLYGLIARNYMAVDFPVVLVFTIVCVLGALVSIVGDLTASAIKRNYDVKDYGKLIPGHGGILDRFDSILFTAPIIYYFIVLAGGLL